MCQFPDNVRFLSSKTDNPVAADVKNTYFSATLFLFTDNEIILNKSADNSFPAGVILSRGSAAGVDLARFCLIDIPKKL